MSMVDRLLSQLRQRELWIEAGKPPDQLLLMGPPENKTPHIIAAVKKFKPDLLKRFFGTPDALNNESNTVKVPKTEPEPEED